MNEEDLDFLRQTMHWPHWPLCPVQRYIKGDKQIGIVVDAPAYMYKVYLKNLFDCEGYLVDILKDVEFLEYKSYNEMLADGWRVD